MVFLSGMDDGGGGQAHPQSVCTRLLEVWPYGPVQGWDGEKICWLSGWAYPLYFRPGTPAARVYPVTEGMALRASPELETGESDGSMNWYI